MSHHIYRTEAIVLGSRESGEADKWFCLFTKEHGLTWAKATSVRKHTSKLRFALSDYSCTLVDLIQGRTGWKITTALPVESHMHILSKEQSALFVRVCALVMRLCRGEEQNELLYDLLRDIPGTLSRIPLADLKVFEIYIMIRVLFYLGYWDADPDSRFVTESGWGIEVKDHIEQFRVSFVFRLNQALKETHL